MIPTTEAKRWNARAGTLILAADAREMGTWSKDSVVLVSELSIRLPRRYRKVLNQPIGEQVLLACGKERLLLVVEAHEVHKLKGGEIIADLSLSGFGATCDRKERTVFQHGIDCYRVIFGRGRPQILLQSRLAF